MRVLRPRPLARGGGGFDCSSSNPKPSPSPSPSPNPNPTPTPTPTTSPSPDANQLRLESMFRLQLDAKDPANVVVRWWYPPANPGNANAWICLWRAEGTNP